jgi:hypothetical protein
MRTLAIITSSILLFALAAPTEVVARGPGDGNADANADNGQGGGPGPGEGAGPGGDHGPAGGPGGAAGAGGPPDASGSPGGKGKDAGRGPGKPPGQGPGSPPGKGKGNGKGGPQTAPPIEITIPDQDAAMAAVRSGAAMPLANLLGLAGSDIDGDVIDARLLRVKNILVYELRVLSPDKSMVRTLYYYARSGMRIGGI